MRVLITGGNGRIGKAATARLLENGWTVRVFDRADTTPSAGTDFVPGDILHYEALIEATNGCDVVIHLAAIPTPFFAPGPQVFQTNAAGTFNVFEAAAANGIRRVVQASSINAIGAFYSIEDIYPQYFPIDENHPHFTTDPYSFSKQTVEEIGAYYWRREGISSVAMRFPSVYSPEFMDDAQYRARRETIRGLLDKLSNMPQAERDAQMEDVKQRVLDFRAKRLFEFRSEPPQQIINSLFEDPLFGTYIADRFNFWAYVDERDAAQALEKALTTDFDGAYPLFINSDTNALGYDAKALVGLFCPEVMDFRDALPGNASLVSIERARKLIGFEPEYRLVQEVKQENV